MESEFNIGDEVIIRPGLNRKCEGVIFVVMKVTPYPDCASKILLKVHVKDNPERILKTVHEDGMDSGWFEKIEKQ